MSSVIVAAGIGRHSYYLGVHETSNATRLNDIAFMPGLMSIAIPKLAVACLLERLLNPTRASKWSPRILYGFSIGCLAYSILNCILFWVQCKSAAALWDPLISKANCWDPSTYIDTAILAGCEDILYLCKLRPY